MNEFIKKIWPSLWTACFVGGCLIGAGVIYFAALRPSQADRARLSERAHQLEDQLAAISVRNLELEGLNKTAISERDKFERQLAEANRIVAVLRGENNRFRDTIEEYERLFRDAANLTAGDEVILGRLEDLNRRSVEIIEGLQK